MRRTVAASAVMIVTALAGVQTQTPLRREIRAEHGVVAAGRSYAADAGARERLICAYDPALSEPEWALGYRFDLVLRGRAATPADPG